MINLCKDYIKWGKSKEFIERLYKSYIKIAYLNKDFLGKEIHVSTFLY